MITVQNGFLAFRTSLLVYISWISLLELIEKEVQRMRNPQMYARRSENTKSIALKSFDGWKAKMLNSIFALLSSATVKLYYTEIRSHNIPSKRCNFSPICTTVNHCHSCICLFHSFPGFHYREISSKVSVSLHYFSELPRLQWFAQYPLLATYIMYRS